MAGRTVYVDPFLLKDKGMPPADVILVSNPRPGFCSLEDIALVRREHTVLFGPPGVVEGARGLVPGDVATVGEIEIRAVPAYTVHTEFFPREREWLGWVVTDGETTVYHAGATDLIPEMEEIRADVAFLPVSGRYVMGPEDAQRAGELVGAREKAGLLLAGDRYVRVPGFTADPGS
jgi:L-ascorbate metabolism protein UlaG (beta-lactamase superfamily)